MFKANNLTDTLNYVHQAIAHYASLSPLQIAVDQGNSRITYQQLDDFSNRLSHHLRHLGVTHNDRVAIYFDNCIESYVAIASTLYVSACYVPLLQNLPYYRLNFMITDCNPKVILTNKKGSELLKLYYSENGRSNLPNIVVLNFIGNDLEFSDYEFATNILTKVRTSYTSAKLECLYSGTSLAYIMYTSGTTGNPKGVMVSQKNVSTFIKWAIAHFSFNSKDRFSGHSRISFDLSVFDMFCAFASGGTLCPVIETSDLAFPGPFITSQKITVWFSVPSVIGMLLKSRQLYPNAFSENLRVALFCGEAMQLEYAKKWIEYLPSIPIYNLYGPTEATVACSYYQIKIDFDFNMSSIPIGFPTSDSKLIVLDDNDEVCPDGITGRLIIQGTQVAPGYWNRQDLTEMQFKIFSSEAGSLNKYETGDYACYKNQTLFWQGRRDQQVKIMGFRVELGEIESVISNSGYVNEVAALFLSGTNPKIVAAIASSHSAEEKNHDQITKLIIDFCNTKLPTYMIPKKFLFLKNLPKNSNGKIDRDCLLKQFTEEKKI